MHRPLILLALVACGAPDDVATNLADDAFAERLAPGPHAVGYQQVAVTYQPATSEAKRTISVELWFPTEPGAKPAEYAVGGIIEVAAPLATTGGLADPGDAPFPVAVYSHGNGGVGLVGYPYGEYLASWGWVVLAPDHKGNTAIELLTDAGDPFLKSAIERPQDISAVLDWVQATEPFATSADASASLLIGHSFGGYTAFAVGGAVPSLDRLDPGCPDEADENCPIFEDPDVRALIAGGFRDPRVVALVPQAPAVGFFEPDAITAVALPTMLQTGGMDITTTPEASALPAWGALDGADDVWIDLPTAGHVTFLSICDDLSPLLLQTFQPNAVDDGCGVDNIPVSEALPGLQAYIGLFADAWVLGRDTAAAIELATPPEGFVVEAR